jgi:hypothetical protein
MPCKRSVDALHPVLLIRSRDSRFRNIDRGVRTLTEYLEFWHTELESFETRLISQSSVSRFSKADGGGGSGFWRSSGAIGDKSNDRVCPLGLSVELSICGRGTPNCHPHG